MEKVTVPLMRIGFCGVFAAYTILAARIVTLNVRDYYIRQTPVKEYEAVQECLSRIPEEDRAYVLGYNAPAKYYLMGDILPCFRYAVLQGNWDWIMEETLQYLAEGEAKWVMTEATCDQPDVLRVLEEQYELVEKNGYIALYRVK